MKLTFFMLVACLSQMAASTYAQTATVSIKAKNESLESVLKKIERQTEFLFFYNADEINKNEKISLDKKNSNIVEIMDEISKNTGILYSIRDRHIVLTARPRSATTSDVGISQQTTRKITGTVTDTNGEPLAGATVVEKGTTNGTVADVEGKFSLTVSENATLQVAFVGCITQEIGKIAFGGNKPLVIKLMEDTQALEEVVVIGYGTQRKGEVASSITTVKSENFIKVPSPDAAQLIRGQVAGLAIIKPDANPLSTSQLSLRGITTLRSSTSPLILIDGIPGALNSISPDEIEQIDVLKDGSAAAIYGTRGTNGVVIITTKSVKGEMPTTVDVNAYLSTQQITRKLPIMTAEQYRNKVEFGAHDYGDNVDYLGEILRTPLSQVYNISLRGGSKTTNYTASFEYRGLEGIIQRSDNQMIYPRVEVTHRMFDNKLKINAGLSGYQQKYFDGSDGGGYQSNVYLSALVFNPTSPAKNENGDWVEYSMNDYYNPLALLWECEGENKATHMRMFANATLTPIEGLDIKLLVSSNSYNQIRGYYETTRHQSTTKSGRNGYASRGTNYTLDNLSELTAQYQKTLLKDHSFMLLGGYSWMKNGYQDYWMQNFDFPSDDYTYNSIQSGQALQAGRATMSSTQRENKLIGYFGRLNYSYKGKYMVAASIRREGSSKFGANHKWGTFPAASIAWNIKGESFLKDVSALSSLKFRVGYGITGTEPSDPYMSLNTLTFANYAYYDDSWIKSIRPGSNPNPDLRWEKKEETNIGLDFGFFNERLTGSIDVYNRDTKDLLWSYTVPSPPYMYSSIIANAGSIRNRGVEISLRAIPVQSHDFQWITNANYSTNTNTLLSLSNDQFISSDYSDQGSTGSPIQLTTHRIKEGWPIGNFYGYKSIDIDDNGHWIIEGEDGNPKPIVDCLPTDKKIIGNGLPKHYLNWNNSISYKNFDLGVTMRGAFGFQIWNAAEAYHASPSMLIGGWNTMEKAFDVVYGKRPLAQDQGLAYVSYYIEDGDYWKIDDLTFGYTLHAKNRWLENFRIYGSISNLAVITGYNGIDPEVNINGLSPGIDPRGRYPAARTFTLGISFKF